MPPRVPGPSIPVELGIGVLIRIESLPGGRAFAGAPGTAKIGDQWSGREPGENNSLYFSSALRIMRRDVQFPEGNIGGASR